MFYFICNCICLCINRKQPYQYSSPFKGVLTSHSRNFPHIFCFSLASNYKTKTLVSLLDFQSSSHLLHILFAFVHFLMEFLLLVWCDRSLGLAVGLSGCSQLLLLAGHVVRFLSCLHLHIQTHRFSCSQINI